MVDYHQDAEAVCEREQAKLSFAQLELNNCRQETEKRVQEKEEEFENTKRNHTRALESMQDSLEAEVKCKSETQRQKKKLESDISGLEVALDHSNRVSADLQKSLKKTQQSIAEQQSALSEEQKKSTQFKEVALASERRANSLLSDMDELRMSVKQADRYRKNAENELRDALNQSASASNSLSALSSQNRKLENDITLLQGELEESFVELGLANEKANKISSELNQAVEDLRQAKESSNNSLKTNAQLQANLKDTQLRLSEAEYAASQGGSIL